MVWELHPEISQAGESPGQSSVIGFRGSLFSVDKTGGVSIPDYARQKEPHSSPGNYASQIREVLRQGEWTGRLRIRHGGDTYCVDPNSGTGWTYVGRTSLGSVEPFEGYVLGAGKNLPLTPPNPGLYSGPHNHGSVGERWTIPDSGWALTQGVFGSVGIRISRGDWAWSTSEHREFIEKMRRMFPYEGFIRFYITCYGYVIRPVMRKFWKDVQLVQGQFNVIHRAAPKSAKSIQYRLNNSRDDPEKSTLYFVCGHVDDLMDGQIPDPDDDDPRTGAINQDQRKWG